MARPFKVELEITNNQDGRFSGVNSCVDVAVLEAGNSIKIENIGFVFLRLSTEKIPY